MAKRRKVGNMLALAVLSAAVLRPMHPYEMATRLRSWGKDQDMKIKWGSLYTVVQNLEKHGFLEVAENRRDGGRPERTVYRITDAGRAELVDWVQELLSVPEKEFPRFEAALSVLAALGPDEVIDLLRQRVLDLTAQLEQRRAELVASAAIPRMFLLEVEYDLAVRGAELAWVQAFLEELVAGEFPGQDQWREYHETGTMPADLVALAEGGQPPQA